MNSSIAVSEAFQNTTTANYDKDADRLYVLGLLTSPICLIGLMGSSFCLYFILTHYKKLQSSTTSLFINLSISTLLFSGLSLPIVCYTMITGVKSSFAVGKYGEFCRIAGWFYMLTGILCTYSNAAIAINRLFVVVLSNYFPVLRSQYVTLVLTLSVWVISVTVSILPYVNVGGAYGWIKVYTRCYLVSLVPWYSWFYRIVYSFFPLGLMLVCYAVILYSIIQARRSMHSVENVGVARPGLSRFLTRRFQKERTATWVALATCAGFMVFFLPVAIFGVAGMKATASTRDAFGMWLQIGCAINPILYILMNSGIRSTFCGHFLRYWSQPTELASAGANENNKNMSDAKHKY